MNKKERTWTLIYTIGEDAGGYWYGSARDDGFIGFLNGCWLVDLLCLWVTGYSRRSYYLFFRTPLPVPVPPKTQPALSSLCEVGLSFPIEGKAVILLSSVSHT